MQRGIDHGSITKVLIWDFVIFHLTLLINGMKDGAVFVMSFVAFGIDLVFKRHRRRRFFYRMMRVSERSDLWLNLHDDAERADENSDALFGASAAGRDTLRGRVEQVVRGGDFPFGVPSQKLP